MTDRCPTPQEIRAFLRGHVVGAEGDRLATHLEDCPDCLSVADGEAARDELLAPVRRVADAPTTHGARAAEVIVRAWQADPEDDRPTVREAAAPVVAAAAPAAVPGYDILGELGHGGMGVVYRARQCSLGRLVALKMLRPDEHVGADGLARFRAEAEALGRLRHPNIVQVYEVGEHQGRPYFSMELVDGPTLAAAVGGRPQDARAAARLVRTLAEAVQAAHECGIVHRDLKPGNVLLREAQGLQSLGLGIPKITDFGLAKRLDRDAGRTATGQVMGTPSYMAPEQAVAGRITPATDVYALGAIFYELLTGRPPFQAANVLETLEMVRQREPVPPSQVRPRLPRDLETVTLKCLRKEPARRYASAAELSADLGRFLAGEPIRARPTPAWERGWKWARRRPALAGLLVSGVVVLLLLLVLLGGSLWYQQREGRRRLAGRAEVQGWLFAAQDDVRQGRWPAALARLDQARRRIDADAGLADLAESC
ncbi:MAG TPA: serine/threonine-protein kinase, partial [Gemmataceae bacterium]|nr:serine/threonine-protein kinase [Gemmataceae bacterium]